MAYMNQAKKKEIAALLKTFMPKSWKYSLSVDNHSSIVMTIKSAPVDLIALNLKKSESTQDCLSINTFYAKDAYEGEVGQLIVKIVEALNLNNFDNSDSMSDYFHCGHYVNLNVGRWNQPFVFTPQKEANVMPAVNSKELLNVITEFETKEKEAEVATLVETLGIGAGGNWTQDMISNAILDNSEAFEVLLKKYNELKRQPK